MMNTKTESVEILRDTWGVPHIYAETELGAIYAQGYAMAQDRLPTIMRAYRKAVGRMAEVFGPDWVDHDIEQRVWRHEAVAIARWSEIDLSCRRATEAFVAGIKTYMNEHPERVPAWSLEPEPYHVIALARYAIWGWPLGQAWEQFERAAPQRDDGRGSNQWAVTARRSASGHVITLIDPHVAWADEWLFYECHLHGGDLHTYGFNITGTPYIGLGHNRALSWAFTTGGPDGADVYELTLHPDNPDQYRYDGAWRTLQVETIAVQVGVSGLPGTGPGHESVPTETVTRQVRSSHHGPVMQVRGNKAYAFKLAYTDTVAQIEEMAMINKSGNLGDFLEALSLRDLMPQNAMYGDIYGNIYYQRTGLVPIRPDGYDWTRPVPGDTSQSEWLGFHATADLVQLLNPPAGWMQNCNISPGTMTENSPLTADRYPYYLYMAETDGSNPRGRRANDLLSAITQMTLEEAIAVANDTFVHGHEPWRTALLTAYEALGGDQEMGQAITILRAWDGRADKESAGMTMFRAWWVALQSAGEPLSGEAVLRAEHPVQAALLAALAGAVRQVKGQFGRLDVPWGECYRARRGDQSWPVSGVAGEHGLVTLRAVNGGEPDCHGISTIQSGQSCTTVVMLEPGNVRSYSVVPYGQSEDPDSSHFTDQGRLLFAEEKLKDSWFARERLEGHIESRQTLTIKW
ncbi:MAG: penicillin acylase family protein [Anaerolineae bacterium]|nr:penicillin acylase family protein [Anaerolineae bacterium]